MELELNDELISAYLDGELNAEQRARVDQLLATSAEARQMLEELQAIRAGLQSLPQHRLEPDFAQKVLRQVQQETAVPAAAATELAPPQAWRPSIYRSWRGIGWSLVAVAAAVLILVATRPSDQDNRQVARESGARPAPPTNLNGVADEVKLKQLRAIEAPQQTAESSTSAAKPAKDEKPAVAQSITQSDFEPGAQNGNITAPASPAPAEMPSVGGEGQASGGASPAMPSMQVTPDRALEKTRAAIRSSISSSDANSVLVVQVGLKSDAAAKADFDQMLANHHIALDSERSAGREETPAAQTLERRDADHGGTIEQLITNALEQETKKQGRATSGSLTRWKEEGKLDRTESSGGADVVYVEASRDQIMAVLKDLGQSKSVISLGVDAGPEVAAKVGGALATARAQRMPRLGDWINRNAEELPPSFTLQDRNGGNQNQAAASPAISTNDRKDESARSILSVDKPLGAAAALNSPADNLEMTAPNSFAGNAANSAVTQRALFVLRAVDISGANKKAADIPPASEKP